MKIYRSYKSIPELAEFSQHEQRAIWMTYFRQHFSKWRTWGMLVAVVVYSIGIKCLFQFVFSNIYPAIHPIVWIVLGAILGTGLALGVFLLHLFSRTATTIQKIYQKKDVE